MTVAPKPVPDHEHEAALLAATSANGSSLGDLLLRTFTPQDPVHVGQPAFDLLRLTALEIKALAIAAAGEPDGYLSDDELTKEELIHLLAALGTRLEAQVELCRRLTEARWDHEGFPGHQRPEGAPPVTPIADIDEQPEAAQ